MGFLVGMPRVLQGAEQAAGGATGHGADNGADRGGRQPAGRDHRAEPGDGEHAEAREQARAAAQEAAGGRAFGGALAGVIIIDAIAMAVAQAMARRVVGDQADVLMRDPRLLQIADGSGGVFVAVKKSGDGLGHDGLSLSVNMIGRASGW
jgi:hypothetical protein